MLGRRTFLVVIAAAALALPPAASGQTPQPEPGFAAPELTDLKCAAADLYPECRRLRFTYGPLTVTPGNNAQLIEPVKIEKPAYDGYMIRFRPDLVRADGKPPPVDEVHLHHAVWLSQPQYGSFLPFTGAGEEKTISETRRGYGQLVKSTDAWLLNYMLHNQTTNPEELWVVYDVDFVPRAAAERRGIKRVVPLWIDVLHEKHAFYPVFNVQRGFGQVNPASGRRECSYPRERCAPTDPFLEEQPGNGVGYDWTVPERFAGTIVGMGGHVHPGGLRDEVSLVRNVNGQDVERRLFDSEAVYYDPQGPVSWDLSMTVTPDGWKVRVEPGDRIRLNAVYDTEGASWYEGMGIVVAYVAPGDESGLDPFRQVSVRKRVRGRTRAGRPRYRRVTRYVRFRTKGPVTHGHLAENGNYGGVGVRPLAERDGPQTENVTISGFRYSPGDLSSASQDGIPRVKADGRLTFRNADAAASIWHTITTCRPPCTGSTGISYPIADEPASLDSTELGYGSPSFGFPVSNRHSYTIEPRKQGLQPGSTYTYFCRVHPFMRGAFKVVE